jgi:polyhydroxybutyrate depolymerase
MINNILKSFMLLAMLLLLCVVSLPGCISIEADSSIQLLDANRTTDNTTIYLPPLEYDYSASIIHDDIERTFIIHVGRSYDATKPTPLVFVLHGGSSSAEVMPAFTGFNTIADRDNFIVVYPDGVENHWNDGREPKIYRTHIENTDDTGFISSLIDALAIDLNIDMKRVFVTGISNGGMMSHRLACELSDRIAAIAPIASSIPTNMADKWEPSKAVSVLIINGTDDPLVPWEGGDIQLGDMSLGNVLPVYSSIEFWVTKNGCQVQPEITRLSERNTDDGTSVWVETYIDCTNNTEVVLFGIDGGGHTWPGSFQYADEHLIGKTSREFDASEIIWQFFKEHPMNQE